jgi:hypothetical protein
MRERLGAVDECVDDLMCRTANQPNVSTMAVSFAAGYLHRVRVRSRTAISVSVSCRHESGG